MITGNGKHRAEWGSMTVVETGVFVVIQRFPGREKTLKRLFKKSESFRTLCEDYRQCALAVRHWGASMSNEAPVRKTEYAALLQELDAEILMELDHDESAG